MPLTQHIPKAWLDLVGKNPAIGWAIEKLGDRARVDGLIYSLAGASIPRGLKTAIALGVYEKPERLMVKKHLPPQSPVIELGGGIGVVSCLINSRLADRSQHLVVEAQPHIATLLRRNAQLNDCHFQVIEAMLGYDTAATLTTPDEFASARVVSGSAMDVSTGHGNADHTLQVTTLEALLSRTGFEHFTLVCDIEGMETQMIAREASLVREHVHTLIMETHERLVGREANQAMLDTLASMGFEQADAACDVVVLKREPKR